MVSTATFGPVDRGSNPDWFAVSNSNQKLSFDEIYLRSIPMGLQPLKNN